MVVNCSIPVQLIDQLPMAVVVINCPPLRGQLIDCHPHRLHSTCSLIMPMQRNEPLSAATFGRLLVLPEG